MKLFRLIVGLIAATGIFAAPACAANITLTQVTSNTVTATIQPDAGDVGKSADVWMAAAYAGFLLLRDGEGWALYSGGPLPVAIKSATLSASMPVTVVVGLDVSLFPGLQVYVGYGANETDMLTSAGKLAQIYPGTPSAFTLAGTVAAGGPVDGATVTVRDSTGASFDGGVTAADGSYAAAIAKSAKPPFVLMAVRDDKTLVSAIAEAKDSTVNITPITDLIASRLTASGNPAKLADELQANPALFDASKLTTKVDEIVSLIKPVMDAVGDSSHPITGKFAADGTGQDKVLDSLSITITPSSATSVNIEVAVKQRLAEGANPQVIAFTNATVPAATLPAVATADLVPTGTSPLIADFLRRLTACYALPLNERVAAGGTAATDIIAPACKSLFAGDDPTSFKSDGAAVSSSGAFSGIFSAASTGAKFDRGSYEFTRSNGDLVIAFRSTSTSGNTQNNTTALTSQGTPAKLKAIGNQYKYNGGIGAYHQLREFVNQPAADYYSTGYNLSINNTVDSSGQPIFNRVEVTSPHGAVFTLKPTTGNSSLSLVGVDAVLTGTSFVRFRSVYADAGRTGDPANSSETSLYFVSPPASEAAITAFAAQSSWKFDYFLAGNTTTTPDATQYYKTRARALTISELKTHGLANLADTDIADWKANTKTGSNGSKYLPTPASGSITLNWTVPVGALPPTSIKVWGGVTTLAGTNFDDSASVASSSRTGSIKCTKQTASDAHCTAGGNYVPGWFNAAHLWATDPSGRQFAHMYTTYLITIVP